MNFRVGDEVKVIRTTDTTQNVWLRGCIGKIIDVAYDPVGLPLKTVESLTDPQWVVEFDVVGRIVIDQFWSEELRLTRNAAWAALCRLANGVASASRSTHDI